MTSDLTHHPSHSHIIEPSKNYPTAKLVHRASLSGGDKTDASTYGIGAVLSQEQGEGDMPSDKKGKPKLHPIAYYSATFTPTERNYDIYEQELLAVMKALAHWRHYLVWTKH